MTSRRRRLIRTFVPIAIAASIPLTIIWILGPIIRNSAEMRLEVQKTNSLIEAPPNGYSSSEPVIAGIETTLTTLHTFDFPNQRDTSDDDQAWEETVRNNLEWADLKRFQIVQVDLGDATASFTTEPEDWTWLIPSLHADRVGLLYCRMPAFAGIEPLIDVLDAAPWKGVVTGEYTGSELDQLVAACTERNIAMHAGFSTYFGVNNEIMAGFTWEQTPPRSNHHIDVRAITDDAPGAVRNLSFLLRMQHRPNGVFTHLSAKEHAYAWIMNTNSQDARNWHSYLRGPDRERPVANVMFDAPRLAADSALAHYQRHFLATLLSGIGMAGYDAAITKGETIPEADVHVVLSEDPVLSDAARSRVTADGPVVWFPVTGLALGGHTPVDVAAFGLAPGIAVDTPGPSPERIDIDGSSIQWQTRNRRDSNPSHIGLTRDAVRGEVLFAADDTPIVIHDGNHAVFNGAALHPHAAHVIAQTISAVTDRPIAMEMPFDGYGVSGTRSAYFATGATELRVRLHHDDGTPFEEGTPIRVVRFNQYGNPRGREELSYDPPFSEIMTANELIIIEPVPGAPLP